jgi:tetratricopeptide (TPR) repeat protein
LLLFVYLLYLLLQAVFSPVDQAYFFILAALTFLYCVFRKLPAKLMIALFYVLPLSVLVQMIYGYKQLAHPWQNLSDITGIFNNTGIFGGWVVMGVVACLGLLHVKNRISRIALSIVLVPITIQLLYSQSRAAWLAAIAGIIVLAIPFFLRLTKRNKLLLLSVLLIIGTFFSFKIYHFKKDSADGRLLIWTVSVNMIKEKPVTGFGTNGFQKNYLLYQADYLKNNPDSPWAYLAGDSISPFNEFLKIGVEQGIIGWLFVLGILFIVFRNIQVIPPVLRAIFVALIVFACFSYPFEWLAFQVLIIFCLASITNSTQTTQIKRIDTDKFKNQCLTIIVVITAYSAYHYYSDVKKWKQTMREHSISEKKIENLKPLYPSLKRNVWFVYDYGTLLYFAGNYEDAIPALEEIIQLFPSAQTLNRLGECYEHTGEYEKALQAWETASYIQPFSFIPHYHIAKLYVKMQDYERAKEKADYILNKKEKIKTAKVYRIKQQMKETIEFINNNF